MRQGTDVVPVKEVMERLGMSQSTVYAGMQSGEIPCIRVMNKRIIPRPAFEEMVRTGRLPEPSETPGREEIEEIVHQVVREVFAVQRDLLDRQLSGLEPGPVKLSIVE